MKSAAAPGPTPAMQLRRIEAEAAIAGFVVAGLSGTDDSMAKP